MVNANLKYILAKNKKINKLLSPRRLWCPKQRLWSPTRAGSAAKSPGSW